MDVDGDTHNDPVIESEKITALLLPAIINKNPH